MSENLMLHDPTENDHMEEYHEEMPAEGHDLVSYQSSPDQLRSQMSRKSRMTARSNAMEDEERMPSQAEPMMEEHMSMEKLQSVEEVPIIDITLEKSPDKGLGVHISGYVSDRKEEAGKIYVKEITPGSPADLDGQIEIGDRILAVNGQRLDLPEISSVDAIRILKQTGNVVTLTLAKCQMVEFEKMEQESLGSKRNVPEGHMQEMTRELNKSKRARLQETWEQILGSMYEIIVSIVRIFGVFELEIL